MNHLRKLGTFLCAAVLSVSAGCVPKAVHPPERTAPATDDYLDLQPGARLRILVPTNKSEGYQFATEAARESGNAIILSSPNPVGYEVSYYSVQGQRHGNVRLRFASAEMTKDGETRQEKRARALPFPLPLQAEHIRLIFLVRSSRADHNMAIAASKQLDDLNSFTDRFKGNPDICKSEGAIFCTWVPQGVAVRPEF
jgi:hypothetical protein